MKEQLTKSHAYNPLHTLQWTSNSCTSIEYYRVNCLDNKLSLLHTIVDEVIKLRFVLQQNTIRRSVWKKIYISTITYTIVDEVIELQFVLQQNTMRLRFGYFKKKKKIIIITIIHTIVDEVIELRFVLQQNTMKGSVWL